MDRRDIIKTTDGIVFETFGIGPFDAGAVTPVRNSGEQNKPAGGLWASPKDADDNWRHWCLTEDYNVEALAEGFRFGVRKGSNICIIDSLDDYVALEEKYSRKISDSYIRDTVLDYEKLARDYDGLYLTSNGLEETRDIDFEGKGLAGSSMDLWDVPNLLVFNADIVVDVEPFRERNRVFLEDYSLPYDNPEREAVDAFCEPFDYLNHKQRWQLRDYLRKHPEKDPELLAFMEGRDTFTVWWESQTLKDRNYMLSNADLLYPEVVLGGPEDTLAGIVGDDGGERLRRRFDMKSLLDGLRGNILPAVRNIIDSSAADMSFSAEIIALEKYLATRDAETLQIWQLDSVSRELSRTASGNLHGDISEDEAQEALSRSFTVFEDILPKEYAQLREASLGIIAGKGFADFEEIIPGAYLAVDPMAERDVPWYSIVASDGSVLLGTEGFSEGEAHFVDGRISNDRNVILYIVSHSYSPEGELETSSIKKRINVTTESITRLLMQKNDKDKNKKTDVGKRRDLTQLNPDTDHLRTNVGIYFESLKSLSKNIPDDRSTVGIITDLSIALGAHGNGPSKYAEFLLSDDRVLTVRLSNHNATAGNFNNTDPDINISIVFKRAREKNTFKASSTVPVKEFAYFKENLTGEHLRQITDSLADALVSGEYIDRTGIAMVNFSSVEVEAEDETLARNIICSSEGYRKGDPQRNPSTAFVFTENAEAYLASSGLSHILLDRRLPGRPYQRMPKLNVSDVNGTNQAGIRTDAEGRVSPNAFGLVVKKFQQGADGRFVASAGQFQDTDADFSLFKDLNTEMFGRLDASPYRKIVFPAQAALGKAALPRRFADWLSSELTARYGLVTEVRENARDGYSGYGFTISSGKKKNIHEEMETENMNEGLKITSARYPDGKPSIELSTRGRLIFYQGMPFDGKNYSALNMRFASGTVINVGDERVDIGGMSVEDVYQTIIKKSGKGLPPGQGSLFHTDGPVTDADREDLFYRGYEPLVDLFASQNPDMAEDLAKVAYHHAAQSTEGVVVLTDMLASTNVSQARAWADILNGRKIDYSLVNTVENKIDKNMNIEKLNDLAYDLAIEITVGGDRFSPVDMAESLVAAGLTKEHLPEFKRTVMQMASGMQPDGRTPETQKFFSDHLDKAWLNEELLRTGEVASKLTAVNGENVLSVFDSIHEITPGVYSIFTREDGFGTEKLVDSDGKYLVDGWLVKTSVDENGKMKSGLTIDRDAEGIVKSVSGFFVSDLSPEAERNGRKVDIDFAYNYDEKKVVVLQEKEVVERKPTSRELAAMEAARQQDLKPAAKVIDQGRAQGLPFQQSLDPQEAFDKSERKPAKARDRIEATFLSEEKNETSSKKKSSRKERQEGDDKEIFGIKSRNQKVVKLPYSDVNYNVKPGDKDAIEKARKVVADISDQVGGLDVDRLLKEKNFSAIKALAYGGETTPIRDLCSIDKKGTRHYQAEYSTVFIKNGMAKVIPVKTKRIEIDGVANQMVVNFNYPSKGDTFYWLGGMSTAPNSRNELPREICDAIIVSGRSNGLTTQSRPTAKNPEGTDITAGFEVSKYNYSYLLPYGQMTIEKAVEKLYYETDEQGNPIKANGDFKRSDKMLFPCLDREDGGRWCKVGDVEIEERLKDTLLHGKDIPVMMKKFDRDKDGRILRDAAGKPLVKETKYYIAFSLANDNIHPATHYESREQSQTVSKNADKSQSRAVAQSESQEQGNGKGLTYSPR